MPPMPPMPPMTKRLFNEAQDLFIAFENVAVTKESADCGNNNHHITRITCTSFLNKQEKEKEKEKETGSSIVFTIGQDYPFAKPVVHVRKPNGKYVTYSSSLMLCGRLLSYTKKLYGLDCLCCSSILCTDNWSPCSSLVGVGNEFIRNRTIKLHVTIAILVEQLLGSHRCEFAQENIMTYLQLQA